MNFLIALQFLTRLPVRLAGRPAPQALGRAVAYYPLAGLVAGLAVWSLSWLSGLDNVRFHAPLWALAVTVFWTWFCSSLHLDGLADTLDGMASGARGPAMLAVMHDSRSGAAAVMGVGLVVLAKWTWLVSLPAAGTWFLPLPFIVARLFSSAGCLVRPYAGRRGSLSSSFILKARHEFLAEAVVWAVLGCGAVLAAAGLLAGVSGRDLLFAGMACCLGLITGGLAIQAPLRRLGGVNGDILGFGQEITEVSTAYLLFFFLVR